MNANFCLRIVAGRSGKSCCSFLSWQYPPAST